MNMLLQLTLPLFLLIAAGALSRRLWTIDPKPLAKLTLYVISPALIFNSLYHSQLPHDHILRLATATVVLIFALSLLLQLYSLICGLPSDLASAMQLGSVFMNVGNYGLPIVSAIAGTAGLERVAVVVVAHQMLMFTLAFYYAARTGFSLGQALAKILQMPTSHAAALALGLRFTAIGLPPGLVGAIQLLCQASVPVFLLLLGMQLAGSVFSRRWWLLTLGSFLKLGLAPLLAHGVALLFALDPLGRQVFILAAASPTAIITASMAVEYEVEPGLVTSLAILTTLLSLVTIPYIMVLLRVN